MGVLRVSGVNSVSSAEICKLSSRQFSPDPSKLTLKILKTTGRRDDRLATVT
jgi:hypothetical protein